VQGEGDERLVCVCMCMVRGLPWLWGGDGEKKEAERTVVGGALKQKT